MSLLMVSLNLEADYVLLVVLPTSLQTNGDSACQRIVHPPVKSKGLEYLLG